MPLYRYSATDPLGKWTSGETSGATREAVEASLLAEGLVAHRLTELESPDEASPKPASTAEVVGVIEQLSALARSGLPLPSGLRAAGEEMVSANQGAILRHLADAIESGASVDEAVGSASRWFPQHLQGVIRAGARSGRLAEFLAEYVRGVNLGSELRRQFWASLAYPLFVFLSVAALVGFVCVLSVNAADSLVGNLGMFGLKQPGRVELLSALIRFISDHWVELAVLIALLPLVGWATLRYAVGPVGRRRFVVSIPIVGPALRYGAYAEFCHLLAMLVESSVPLPVAFELAGQGARDAQLAESASKMGRAIEEGKSFSEALVEWNDMPAGLRQLFEWSQSQRNLPEALHLAGEMFESRARSQTGFAGGVLTTFLVLLIVWGVGFVLAALYLPLYTMITLFNFLI